MYRHLCVHRVSALFTSRSVPSCLNHILSLCFQDLERPLINNGESYRGSNTEAFIFQWTIWQLLFPCCSTKFQVWTHQRQVYQCARRDPLSPAFTTTCSRKAASLQGFPEQKRFGAAPHVQELFHPKGVAVPLPILCSTFCWLFWAETILLIQTHGVLVLFSDHDFIGLFCFL